MRNLKIDDAICGKLFNTPAMVRTMTSLDLSYNIIGMQDLIQRPSKVCAGEVIATLLLDGHCKLTSLNLAWNNIRSASAIALVDALKDNHTLQYLDLSHNCLGIEGGERLGNALHFNDTLEVLKIANNGFPS